MTLVSQAMARDFRNQPQQFAELRDISKVEPPLTDLRTLNILAWDVGQQSDGEPVLSDPDSLSG